MKGVVSNTAIQCIAPVDVQAVKMNFDLAVPHGSRSLSELSSSTDLVGMPIFARALNSIPTAGSREKSRWLRLGRSAAGEGSCCLRELKRPKISSRPLCCDDALLGTMARAAEDAMDGGRNRPHRPTESQTMESRR